MKLTLARFGLVALVVAGLAGAGCGGGGGGGAPAGGGGTPPPSGVVPAPVPPGAAPIDIGTLTSDQIAALQPQIVFGNAVVASPPAVSFAVQDPAGNPIIGLGVLRTQGDLNYLRFGIAKLVPGAPAPGTPVTTPSKWVNYIVLGSDGNGSRPNVERTGTLVDNGNGTYVYTFATDIATVAAQLAAAPAPAGTIADLGDLTYDASLTHRLVIQLSGGGMAPANGIYDFIPATGNKVTAADFQRQVVSIDNCNECHNKLAIHGGNRIDTQFCVICHTDQRKFGRTNVASVAGAFPALTEDVTTDPDTGYKEYDYSPNLYLGDGETMGDFPRMVHKIHHGHNLTKQNYNYAGLPFNLIGYPMLDEGERMCTKCHDNGKAAQADNWKNLPSQIACGACHDNVNFATGANHIGGIQPDTRCALCHDGTNIPVYHQTENITEHNPTIEPGLVTFTYEIDSATVDGSNNLAIKFRINADGTPLTDLALVGFSGDPDFLLAWAVAQDAIATPADHNNTTNAKGDGTSIAINDLLNSSKGTLTGPDASGYFTATIPSGANSFPLGAIRRTVALQSYWTQSAGTNGIASNTGRHAISVVKTVTGDTPRRLVVNPANCANCHEWLELHGGSRVIGKETQGLYVCVMCHLPAKPTSGRGITDAAINDYVAAGNLSSGDLKILTEWGVTPLTFPVATGDTWALQLPVTSNNFKDMIHGIHKGRERVAPFQDARDRLGSGCGDGNPATSCGGGFALLDFRRMNFPGIINECETCHLPGTYNSVPAGALPSTYESIGAVPNTTAVLAKAALAQPNPEDIVTSPFAAACVSCHDSTTAKSHMTISGGGQLMVPRSTFTAGLEQCSFCHGPGKIVDAAVVHTQ